MSNTVDIQQYNLIKKERNGIHDDDLGYVQYTEQDTVVTKAATATKRNYSPHKGLIEQDGHNLILIQDD
jgi:hypothetical protein